MTWSERPLFGGAIMCEIPSEWRDVSDVRQVPDNQEVWQEANTNVAVVVEILEYQEQVPNAKAASFFFQNLAEDNGIVSQQDLRFDGSPQSSAQALVPSLSNTPNATICVGKGYQKVAIGREFDIGGNRREQTVTTILAELCVVRLKEKETDLLVTLSTPCEDMSQPQTQLSDTFRRLLSTLVIKDWGLFC